MSRSLLNPFCHCRQGRQPETIPRPVRLCGIALNKANGLEIVLSVEGKIESAPAMVYKNTRTSRCGQSP